MKFLCTAVAAFWVAISTMAVDPNWSTQYSFSQTPEQNGFTRILYGSPVVTLVTGGQAANRRIELNTANGDVVFLLSTTPALNNKTLGATVEVVVAVTGSGNAGYELTFQTNHFGVQVYTDRITVVVNDGNGPVECAVGLLNILDTTVRATVTPEGADGVLRVYRNGLLVYTKALVPSDQPLPRVLFWGEEGGTQIIRAMKFYIGGPVAP